MANSFYIDTMQSIVLSAKQNPKANLDRNGNVTQTFIVGWLMEYEKENLLSEMEKENIITMFDLMAQ